MLRELLPHPRNPAGVDLPVEDLVKSYDTMISSGERTFANFLLFKGAGPLARNRWNEAAGPPDQIEGRTCRTRAPSGGG